MHPELGLLTARFVFKPERAAEFVAEGELPDGQVYQPSVTQLEYTSIEEVMVDVRAFQDALIDCNVIVPAVDGKGKLVARQVNLSDFTEEDD